MKYLTILALIGIVYTYRQENHGKGHLKPLGEQHECLGHIDVIDDIPSPIAFFRDYIKASKPVVFRNGAKNMPAFKLWTDEYLRNNFGEVKVDVEEGKKENRSLNLWKWPFEQFLDEYQKSDVYMVHSLPKEMRKDLSIFPVVSCGGYTKVISDVIMWFSSGGTKSVLHNDHIDNINCLFAGNKQLYMVDYKYKEHIDFDAPAGGFSHVDVDAVDLDKYPGLEKAPWWRAEMQAGDCLFIPSRWFHQVRSFAENKRNMAVNVWFYNMKKINETDCEKGDHVGAFLPMNEFSLLKDKGERVNGVKFLLSLDVGDKKLTYKEMYKVMKEHIVEEFDKSFAKEALLLLDKNKDKFISKEDIDMLTSSELQALSTMYPGLTMEEGEEDDEEDNPNEEEQQIDEREEL